MATKEIPRKYKAGWLEQLDGRMALAQDMRQRFQEFARDLGGVDELSYSQKSLIERALWLEYWLSTQERTLANGEPFDVSRWIQAANSLQGLMHKLGLERREPSAITLQDYIKARSAEE
jgi:hypothetical protein